MGLALTPNTRSLRFSTMSRTGFVVSLIAHSIHEEIMNDAIEWGVIGGDKETEGMKDKTGLDMTPVEIPPSRPI